MNDQADNLRKAIERLENVHISKPGNSPPAMSKPAGPARVVAVSSGKGGVGKTSISVNLALALSEMHLKPLLIDADIGLANVEVLFGLTPKYKLMDVINNEKALADIICEGPRGVRFISGGSGVDELARVGDEQMASLVAEVAELDSDYDIIIIDTGAGISETILSMAAAADEVIVVTTPEPTSVTDAYALVKSIVSRDHGKVLKLIVNRAENEAEAAEVTAKLSRVSDKFLDLKLQKLGYILNDPLVVRSVKQQQPFMLGFPHCQTSKSIREIAIRLMEGTAFTPSAKSRGFAGFLGGLAKIVNNMQYK